MAAAVVELDALSDAVRAAAQYHNGLFIAPRTYGFARIRVGAVVIRRDRLEFARASIDRTETRQQADPFALRHHVGFGRMKQERDLTVAVAEFLRLTEERGIGGEVIE